MANGLFREMVRPKKAKYAFTVSVNSQNILKIGTMLNSIFGDYLTTDEKAPCFAVLRMNMGHTDYIVYINDDYTATKFRNMNKLY